MAQCKFVDLEHSVRCAWVCNLGPIYYLFFKICGIQQDKPTDSKLFAKLQAYPWCPDVAAVCNVVAAGFGSPVVESTDFWL